MPVFDGKGEGIAKMANVGDGRWKGWIFAFFGEDSGAI